MTRRQAGNEAALPALDASSNAFRDLLHGVLLQASQGSPRAVFFGEFLRTLLDFSRADEAVLRFPEGGRTVVCRLQRAEGSEPLFELRTEDAAGREARRRTGTRRKERPSTILLALSLAGEAAGQLTLSRAASDPFSPAEVLLLHAIPETLSLALAHQRSQWALRERVKELTCLYGIARAVEHPGLSVDGVLQRIVGLLPSAWQYPDVTAAAITLDGTRLSNPGFRPNARKQISNVLVRGTPRGVVEVAYLEEKPDVHEGPFLAEERSLIDEVARQMPAVKAKTDLNRVVTEGLYLVEARCAAEGIRLVRDLDPALAEIVADSGQLQQVLMNLVVNGIQATTGGGTLTIRTRNRPGGVVLSVEDTGAGIDEETLKEIFNPFFTLKEVGQGTGLGLSVVHGIVSSHGGTIRVESEPGRGSRFDVDLPLEGPAGA